MDGGKKEAGGRRRWLLEDDSRRGGKETGGRRRRSAKAGRVPVWWEWLGVGMVGMVGSFRETAYTRILATTLDRGMGKGGQIRTPKSLGDPLGSPWAAAEWSLLRARLPQRDRGCAPQF